MAVKKSVKKPFAKKPKVIGLSMDDDSADYLFYLSQINDKATLYKGIFKLFNDLAMEGAGFISENYVVTRLRSRSTLLAKSVVGGAVNVSGVPGYRIGILRGPALRYAGIQDQGTRPFNPQSEYKTIVPVNAKALAMPSHENQTPTGITKRPLKSFPQRGQPGALHFIPFRSSGVAIGGLYDPKDIEALRKRNRASGNWVLGSLHAISPLFILLEKTDIKPTFWLRDGFLAWLPKVTKALADYLQDLLLGKEV